MTLKEAYEYGRERLNAAGIEECSVDAWYLLEFVTGLDRTAYFLKPDEKITDEQGSLYKAYLEQRGAGIFHFSISQVFRNLWDWNLRSMNMSLFQGKTRRR